MANKCRFCVSITLATSAIFLIGIDQSNAGIISIDGDEECMWANKCLIVAKVVKIERDLKSRQTYVTLGPMMTIAGSFDCAAMSKLRVPMVLGPFGSVLDQPPPVGSTVAIHLELCNDGYFIPGYLARYMPDGLPAWEVWGFHDETLLKIVSKVGERRREGSRKDKERRADCAMWLNGAHPKHAEHVKPPVDKSFEKRSVLFGRVKSIKGPNEDGERVIFMMPIGTVAGQLDTALAGEIRLKLPAKLAEGRELPWHDAEMFVAVDDRDGELVLVDEELDYMPSGWAFSKVETNVEATCDKILTNLRKRLPRDGAGNGKDKQAPQR